MKRACRIGTSTGEEGQSVLEIALILPVLLLIVTGMVNFGIAIKNYSVLTDAVSVAARQLSISRGQTADPCSTVSNAVILAAPSLTSSNMTFTTTVSANGSQWVYSGASCSSPNTYSGAAGNLLFNGTVQVKVAYPYSLWRYGTNRSSFTLTAATTETVQ